MKTSIDTKVLRVALENHVKDIEMVLAEKLDIERELEDLKKEVEALRFIRGEQLAEANRTIKRLRKQIKPAPKKRRRVGAHR